MLDHYLAKVGFKGQQDPTPVGSDRKDNLFEPVPGDHGAHGRFDEEAVDGSAEYWVSRHKAELAAAAGIAAASAGFMFATRSAERRKGEKARQD